MTKPTLATLQKIIDMGIGTSLYQISSGQSKDFGQTPNQWDIAQIEKRTPELKNVISAWDTIENYLPILQNMGIKHLRFSVEWNYIEPRPGQFNAKAISRYQQLIAACNAYHIEPMLTLYHFTQPLWFQLKGGFEKEKNIADFLHYAQYVVEQLSPDVKLWCTINEPAVEAFTGYLYGKFPPFQYLALDKASLVLKHLLQAHVELVANLEKTILRHQLKIGLVHNILRFESHSSLIQKYLTHPLTEFTHELFMQFMLEGKFNYRGIHYHEPRSKGNCCFLNIYGDVQIGYLGPTCKKHQQMGDMYIAIYPESYHQALEQARHLNMPIYITETGIADEHDLVRPQFIIEILRCVLNQIHQGQEIERLYFWTFKDNYEWHLGHEKHFGLFDQFNQPRHSAYLLTWIIKNFKSILEKEQNTELVLAQWQKLLSSAEEKIQKNQLDYFSKSVKL